MTKLVLPASWIGTMEQVRSVLPSAYLAGGALRDLDNDRCVKDFDVFFTEAFDVGKVDQALDGLYSYYRHCPGEYMGDTAQEVQLTYTYVSQEGLPDLNFIGLDPSFNPADIIERVDFGLCQIGYDLLGVVTTEAYERDKRDQKLTLTRGETIGGVMRSLKRYERLSQKYQGWELRVPVELQDLVEAAKAAEVMEGLDVA